MNFNDLFCDFLMFAILGFIIIEIFCGVLSIFYFTVIDRCGR